MEIEGCSAIVTGGASGLGAAVVRSLERDGAAVVVFDLDTSSAAAEEGRAIVHVSGDVTSTDDVQRAVSAAADLAPLRILVNCAGIGSGERIVRRRHPGGIEVHDLERFRRVIEVNLVGTFDMMRRAAARMATVPASPGECSGVIVNTSSIAAFDGQVGQAAYAAAKAGVVGLTLAAARDLAGVAVRVNTIAPGLMDTPILQTVAEPARSGLIRDVVFPSRMGTPAEFAHLVTAIVRNDYLNGETIRLDAAARLPPRSSLG